MVVVVDERVGGGVGGFLPSPSSSYCRIEDEGLYGPMRASRSTHSEVGVRSSTTGGGGVVSTAVVVGLEVVSVLPASD